jgi:glycosyltransferase involved in cell wall biosynthesis
MGSDERSSPSSSARRLPVCFLYPVFHHAQAGTERHLLLLIRSLDPSAFDRSLVVLHGSEFLEAWREPHVPLHVLGYRSFFRPQDWTRIASLSRFLRRHRVRVLQMHTPDDQFVGTLAGRWARVPALVACRRNLGYAYTWKQKWQTRLTNRLVTRFVANSTEVMRQISRLEGTDAERFDVIYNGVDLAAFDRELEEPVDAALESALRDRVVVSVVANLRPVKNLPLLLRAARYVAARDDRVRFAVYGQGPDESSLRRMADELGVADRVLWPGSVATVAPYLHRSHIGCLTSDSEGFANAILEYMAASLPVVATRVGGAADAVDHGRTGFLVPAGDAPQIGQRIVQLADDPQLRASMGAAGRQRVEQQFTFARQVAGYQALYRRLAE